MTLDLSKGSDLVLSKPDAPLANVEFGLGWDAANGQALDMDASIVVCQGNTQKGVLYYGNKALPGLKHSGDDLTGEGSDDGPDEIISANLGEVQGDRLELICTIHQAAQRGQSLASAERAFMTLGGDYKGEDGSGARFTITGSGLSGYAAHFATIIRKDDGWHVITRGDDLGQIDLNQAVDKVTALSSAAAA